MNKRVLIVGDSCTLPRKEVYFDNLYPSLLKNELIDFDFVVSAKYKATVKDIKELTIPYIEYGYKPNIVILQYGIVDAFPRPYPRYIEKYDIVRRLLKKLNLFYKFSDLFDIHYTSLFEFSFISESIIKLILDNEGGNTLIIFVNIPLPKRILLKSKKALENICAYNKVFKTLKENYDNISIIDIFQWTDEYFIYDGYHLNKDGHKKLADEIKRIIANE